MSHLISEKSFDCLLFVGRNFRDQLESYSGWERRWTRLCEKWGEKRVVRCLESLSRRGYIDYGVSVRGGWLTDRGAIALMEYAMSLLQQASPQVGKTPLAPISQLPAKYLGNS